MCFMAGPHKEGWYSYKNSSLIKIKSIPKPFVREA